MECVPVVTVNAGGQLMVTGYTIVMPKKYRAFRRMVARRAPFRDGTVCVVMCPGDTFGRSFTPRLIYTEARVTWETTPEYLQRKFPFYYCAAQ